MTHLTDKREAPVSAVGISGMAAHRASFARRVGIDLESHTSRTSSFIGDHAVQLGKGPFGVRGILFPLLRTRPFAVLTASRSLPDVRQVFQPDQAVWVLLVLGLAQWLIQWGVYRVTTLLPSR
jgi:hypothetical protein